MLPEWLPTTVRASKNSNYIMQLEYLEFTSNVRYLECNVNVPGVSRILPDYFPIGYKMLPNLAVSLPPADPRTRANHPYKFRNIRANTTVVIK